MPATHTTTGVSMQDVPCAHAAIYGMKGEAVQWYLQPGPKDHYCRLLARWPTGKRACLQFTEHILTQITRELNGRSATLHTLLCLYHHHESTINTDLVLHLVECAVTLHTSAHIKTATRS